MAQKYAFFLILNMMKVLKNSALHCTALHYPLYRVHCIALFSVQCSAVHSSLYSALHCTVQSIQGP